MIEPTGYTALDLIGFTDRGGYDPDAYYVKNDIVTVGNTKWRCLIDDTHNVTPTEGVNWTIYLESATSLAGMDDVDLTTPADGDIVVYNGTSQKWENTHDEISAIENVYGSKNICDVSNAPVASNVVSGMDANGIISFKDVSTAAWSSSYIAVFRVRSGVTYEIKTSDGNGIPYGRIGISNSPTGIPSNATAPNVTFISGGTGQVITVGIASSKFTANADQTIYAWYCTDTSTSSHATFTRGLMVLDDRIKDRTYVPYVPTNRDCMSYAVNTKLGAKNLLNYNVSSQSVSGITFTVNSNKSITWSGKHESSTSNIFLLLLDKVTMPAGTYKLTGCPQGGSLATYKQQISIFASDGTTLAGIYYDYGDGVVFTVAEGQKVSLYSPHSSATNYNNNVSGTFYPMIRLAEDTDPTYAPYTMTNGELTEVKITNIASALSTATGLSVDYGTLIECGKYVELNFQLHEVSASINKNVNLESIIPSNKIPKYRVFASLNNRDGGGGISWITENTRFLQIRVDTAPSSKDIQIIVGYYY